MDITQAMEKISQKLQYASSLNARIKFDFGEDGAVFVDGTQNPAQLSALGANDEQEADCTLACSLDTFTAILNGSQDPNIAFMMGRLKVRGSMGLALKLSALLES